jgi:hypothetical protein
VDGSSVRRVLQRAPLPGALPVCDGTWHHAALTFSADGSASALLAFVDGDLVHTVRIERIVIK